MTAGPTRLQLERRKGFNLQKLSKGYNGLDAVVITRSTCWGNPFAVHPNQREGRTWGGGFGTITSVPTIERALEAYRDRLEFIFELSNDLPPDSVGFEMRCRIGELRGKNLACYCRFGEPCHGDILLEFANRPVCEEVE